MNATQTTVPALQYERVAHESFEELARGEGRHIKEIFIPSYNIIINSAGGIMVSEKPCNIQEHLKGPRTVIPMENIEISTNLAQRVAKIGQLKIEIKNHEKELAPELQKLWI